MLKELGIQPLLSPEFIESLRRKLLKQEIMVPVHLNTLSHLEKKKKSVSEIKWANTQVSSEAMYLGQWTRSRAIGSSISLSKSISG